MRLSSVYYLPVPTVKLVDEEATFWSVLLCVNFPLSLAAAASRGAYNVEAEDLPT